MSRMIEARGSTFSVETYPPVSINTSYPRSHNSVINGNTFFCASGSPPVTSTRLQPNSSSFEKISSDAIFSPPVKVYSLSHQTHRIGQPVKRTNEHGRPA